MGAVYPPSYAPRFTVLINGEEFPEYDYISDIVVDTTIDGADYFSITLTYPFNHEHVSFEQLDWDLIAPGNGVTIKMGYGEGDSAAKDVFSGEIEAVRPKFPANEPPRVVITGYGPMRKMMSGTNSESWEGELLEDVVGEVAGKYLGMDIEKAEIGLGHIFQDDESDYEFVQKLAARHGFEFLSILGEGHFRPKPAGDPEEGPIATLYYGESIEMFSGELKLPEHGELEVRHWDEEEKEEIVGSASNAQGSGKEVIRVQVDSEGEANTIAQSKLSSLQLTGVVETFGVPSIKAGKVVTLEGLGNFTGEGLGDVFSDDYYVTNATHRFGETGYRMTMEVTALEE